MHQVLFAMSRKDGTSVDDVIAHYRDVHIPMTGRFRGRTPVRRFPVQKADGGERPDAFACMAFDSVQDFEAIQSTELFQEAMNDSATFVRQTDAYVVDHIPVVDNGGNR